MSLHGKIKKLQKTYEGADTPAKYKTMENENLRISRVVVYTHKSLVVKLRPDLMSDSFSSIWMEIGLPRKKKFLVCQLYREWQYLGQPDRASSSIPAQLDRWVTFLDPYAWASTSRSVAQCTRYGALMRISTQLV